jgi:hypothetical protein
MSIFKITGKRRWEVFLISMVVLLHIVYFAINYRRGSYSLGVDGPRYKSLAIKYAESETILGEDCKNLFWTPWFIYIALLGGNPIAVFLFNLASFTLVLVMLSKLADFLSFPQIGKALLLLAYGLYWPLFDYCVFYHYEIFLSLVFTASVFLIAWKYKSFSESVLQWVSYGLIAGLGIFAHTKALGSFFYGLYFLLSEKREMRKWLLKLCVLVFLSLMFVFLWGVRNKIVAGRWVFSSTAIGYNLYVGFNPVAKGTFAPQPTYPPVDEAFSMALDYIRAHPHRSLYLVFLKVVKFWFISPIKNFGPAIFIIQEWIIIPLSLLGFLIVGFKLLTGRIQSNDEVRNRQKKIALGGMTFFVLYFMIFHAVFYIDLPRFRLPIMPMLCVFAVYFLLEIVSRVRGSISKIETRTAPRLL